MELFNDNRSDFRVKEYVNQSIILQRYRSVQKQIDFSLSCQIQTILFVPPFKQHQINVQWVKNNCSMSFSCRNQERNYYNRSELQPRLSRPQTTPFNLAHSVTVSLLWPFHAASFGPFLQVLFTHQYKPKMKPISLFNQPAPPSVQRLEVFPFSNQAN